MLPLGMTCILEPILYDQNNVYIRKFDCSQGLPICIDVKLMKTIKLMPIVNLHCFFVVHVKHACYLVSKIIVRSTYCDIMRWCYAPHLQFFFKKKLFLRKIYIMQDINRNRELVLHTKMSTSPAKGRISLRDIMTYWFRYEKFTRLLTYCLKTCISSANEAWILIAFDIPLQRNWNSYIK